MPAPAPAPRGAGARSTPARSSVSGSRAVEVAHKRPLPSAFRVRSPKGQTRRSVSSPTPAGGYALPEPSRECQPPAGFPERVPHPLCYQTRLEGSYYSSSNDPQVSRTGEHHQRQTTSVFPVNLALADAQKLVHGCNQNTTCAEGDQPGHVCNVTPGTPRDRALPAFLPPPPPGPGARFLELILNKSLHCAYPSERLVQVHRTGPGRLSGGNYPYTTHMLRSTGSCHKPR